MKFIVFIAILFIATLSATKISHRNHMRNHNSNHKKTLLENAGQFALGFFDQLLGGVVAGAKSCIETFKPAEIGEEELAESETVSNGEQTKKEGKSIWTVVKDVLFIGGEIITKVCQVESLIRQISLYILPKFNGKSRRRMFFQDEAAKKKALNKALKMSTYLIPVIGPFIAFALFRKEIMHWAWEGGKDTFRAGCVKADDAGKRIKEVIAKSRVWVLENVVQPAIEKINDLKDAIYTLINGAIFKRIMSAFQCLNALAKPFLLVYQAMKNVALLGTGPAGWVIFVLGLVCSWMGFRDTVNYIIAGVAATGKDRWLNFGRALGKLLNTIGTSSFFLKKLT